MGPLVLVDGRGKEIGRLPAEVVSGEVEIHWGTFTRILYEAVRDDVNYRFGVRITALDDDGQRVEVTFSDGSTGSYDLVIGADGLHSGDAQTGVRPRRAVRHPAGPVFRVLRRRKPFAAGPLRHGVHRRRPDRGVAGASIPTSRREPAFPHRPAAWISTTATPKATSDCSRSDTPGWGGKFRTFSTDLAKAPEVYFDSIAQVHLDSYARGRVCLTGDAAWCASPRSGMGTTLAMVGAYVLAHELQTAGERLRRGVRPVPATDGAVRRAVSEDRASTR